MKRLPLWAVLALAVSAVAPHLFGQAVPTASRRGGLQIGAGYSFNIPDYGPKYVKGVSGWADLEVTQHLGAEIAVHENSIWTPTDIGENSYMIGPRYTFHYKQFDPYVKVMFGYGVFQTQYDFAPHTSEAYFAYAGGGGIDYRFRPHITIRAVDFEYQKWPNFPPNGLSPVTFTFGAAYVF